MEGFSFVTVKIEGMNFEILLNKLMKNKIKVLNANRKAHNILILTVESKNLKSLIAITRNACYNVSVESYRGMAQVVKLLARNIGVIVGIAVVCVCSFVYSSLILKVKVSGTNRISTSEIVSFLKTNNISEFKPISSIETKNIEQELLQKFEDVSLVSVCVKGCTLEINIKEKIYTDLNENLLDNIVADCDCQINTMIVSSGTAVVKVGDCVKKGDIIVSGFYLDENGNKISVKARAQISVNVFISESVVVPKTKKTLVETGNKTTVSQLCLKKLKLNKLKLPAYTHYSTKSKTINLMLIPFRVTYLTYYEMEEIEIETNFEANKDILLR